MSIYLVCLIIGIAVPFFTLVLGIVDGFIELVSFEIGHSCIDILPLSINSICAGLLIFGGVGLTMMNIIVSRVILNILAAFAGYFFAVLIQTLINKLRKVQHLATKTEELLAQIGEVIHKIPENGLGTISLVSKLGSTVTYPAKTHDGIELPIGAKVEVVELIDSTVIVKEKCEDTSKHDINTDK